MKVGNFYIVKGIERKGVAGMISRLLDIPSYLELTKNDTRGWRVIGVIEGEIEQPFHLRPAKLKNSNDKFVVISLVGVETSVGTFYAKGRMLTIMNGVWVERAKQKKSGKLAVVLSNSKVHLADGRTYTENFVQMLSWAKGDFNDWRMVGAKVEPFTNKENAEFFQVISTAYRNNWKFDYPVEEPKNYTEACEGYDFSLLGLDESNMVKESTPIDEELERVNQQVIGVLKEEPKPVDAFVQVEKIDLKEEKKAPAPPVNHGASRVTNTPPASSPMKDTASVGVMDSTRTYPKVETRNKLLPETKNVRMMMNTVNKANARVKAITKRLSIIGGKEEGVESDDTLEKRIAHTAKMLKESWGRRVGDYTGRSLFKEAVETVLDIEKKESATNSPIDDVFSIMNMTVLEQWVSLDPDFSDNQIISDIYLKNAEIYFCMVEKLLGLSHDLSLTYTLANRKFIDFFKVLKSNPYMLIIINPSISLKTLDMLSLSFNLDINESLKRKARNMAFLHHYLLDSSNQVVGENTLIDYKKLAMSVKSGIQIDKKAYDSVMLEGTPISQDKIETYAHFIDDSVKTEYFSLPKKGWVKNFNTYTLHDNNSVEELIQDYLDSGLGIKLTIDGVDYISSYVYAFKELYIYKRARELSKYKPSPIKKEDIEKTINEFEYKKTQDLGIEQFKLEPEQADAFNYLTHPLMCLIGTAGSGKTTTVEGLVYGAKKLLNIDDKDILYTAPTGMAANRLKEVVKARTLTINSAFGISGENTGMIEDEEDQPDKKEGIKLLIIDEMSMPNLHLLYELFRRLENGVYVYFIGDIEQLPPIGTGKPFAGLLSFLPTVRLNVTKRASEGSTITRNSKKLIYESDGGVLEDLESGEDFSNIHVTDQYETVQTVCSIVKYHLGKEDKGNLRTVTNQPDVLNPDDIQIITPVNKNIWGTIELNKSLQDIFNPKKRGQAVVTYSRLPNQRTELRVNDRVMHTRVNQRDRDRFIHVKDNMFILEKTKGVCNGDVGKIKGFFFAKDLDFSEMASEDRRNIESNYRGTDNTLYVGVEYTDVSEESGEAITFVILYRAELLTKSGGFMDVMSRDLYNVELAYASTVHKLQGSQRKLIICVFLPIGGGKAVSTFISRNLINTAITRASESVYMIGDILGANSTVNKGRRVKQTEIRNVLLDYL